MTDRSPLDLAPALQAILAFRDARDWQQFHTPKDLAAALSIEVGELQELFLWRAAEPGAAVAADDERMPRVREELADCAIYLLLLAHELGVDLPDAITTKLRANEARYPAGEHRGVARKAPPAAD
jgi:dCTP diphosphatase